MPDSPPIEQPVAGSPPPQPSATGPVTGQASSREPLTRDDVAKVARLAMLDLSEADLDLFTGQLDAVLDLAGRLEGFDVGSVPPTSHPFGLTNVLRADIVEAVPDAESVRREVLACGPDIEDGRFKVPPALGEAP